MENFMDISKYTSLFHDGSIINIVHKGNDIIIPMESAEIDKEDVEDMALSKKDTIKGKLHLIGVTNIKENGRPFDKNLKMKYDDGEIFRFKINKSKIELQIKWNSSPPKPYIEDFSTIEIEAKKIWWENVPNSEVFS